MAITNRITGQSLQEEMGSRPPQNPSPSEKRRESAEMGAPASHTMLYILEQMEQDRKEQQQIVRKLEELTQRLEIPEEEKNPEPKLSDEVISDMLLNFDDGCKKIVRQRLADATKESGRISDKLAKTAEKMSGFRRMIRALLWIGILNLAALTALVILIWNQF